MTNESKNENGAELTQEQIVEDSFKQSEEQVEELDANEAMSAEQEKINELELALVVAKSTINDQKDSVIRAKAEVDNVRRRSAQDVEKARKFALDKFAAELLPVVDNLERAIESVDKEDEGQKGLAEGVELTLQSMMAALDKFGVKVVDPLDQPFNPELHQAMSMQEIDGVAPNTVIAVMQRGYELNGRLVRPAMVMVSKAAPIVDVKA